MGNRLYLKQYEIGQMANFVYLIGDQLSREVAIVDPAWEIEQLIRLAQADDMKITKVFVTHYHPDHVGGNLLGFNIEGVRELLEKLPIKVYTHKAEAKYLKKIIGLEDSDMVVVEGGETVRVGEVGVTFIHTPGHTPGSQCFLVEGHLVSGDTLFIGSCGRVDLPGSNPEDMYYSLTQTLKKLPDEIVLLPGHNYGGRSSTLGQQKKTNMYMNFPTLTAFLAHMGY
ncbi:MAG: MBL fold metallo-hydrolase [Acidobacteriota bacterium]|nr:MBL fold metallo-hydrolase [Blastocatellia bacterium]MDW8412196.1 MBL fold metallo-hydrolase [Acidobacteriota bacterium]